MTLFRLLAVAFLASCAPRPRIYQLLVDVGDVYVPSDEAVMIDTTPTIRDLLGEEGARRLWGWAISDVVFIENVDSFVTIAQLDGTVIIEHEDIYFSPRDLRPIGGRKTAVTVDESWTVLGVQTARPVFLPRRGVTWGDLGPCSEEETALYGSTCTVEGKRVLVKFALTVLENEGSRLTGWE